MTCTASGWQPMLAVDSKACLQACRGVAGWERRQQHYGHTYRHSLHLQVHLALHAVTNSRMQCCPYRRQGRFNLLKSSVERRDNPYPCMTTYPGGIQCCTEHPEGIPFAYGEIHTMDYSTARCADGLGAALILSASSQGQSGATHSNGRGAGPLCTSSQLSSMSV